MAAGNSVGTEFCDKILCASIGWRQVHLLVAQDERVHTHTHTHPFIHFSILLLAPLGLTPMAIPSNFVGKHTKYAHKETLSSPLKPNEHESINENVLVFFPIYWLSHHSNSKQKLRFQHQRNCVFAAAIVMLHGVRLNLLYFLLSSSRSLSIYPLHAPCFLFTQECWLNLQRKLPFISLKRRRGRVLREVRVVVCSFVCLHSEHTMLIWIALRAISRNESDFYGLFT